MTIKEVRTIRYQGCDLVEVELTEPHPQLGGSITSAMWDAFCPECDEEISFNNSERVARHDIEDHIGTGSRRNR